MHLPVVPCAQTATGQQSFAVNGPTVWNSLPPALRSPDLAQNTFKRALKTHLFSSVQRLTSPGSALRSPPSLAAHVCVLPIVLRMSTSTFGPRAFCSSDPLSWNALPSQLRDPAISIDIFRQSLENFNNFLAMFHPAHVFLGSVTACTFVTVSV